MKKITLVYGAVGAIVLAAGLAAAPMMASSAASARATGPVVGAGIVPPTPKVQSAARRPGGTVPTPTRSNPRPPISLP